MSEIAIYAGIAFLSATVGFFAGALMAMGRIATLSEERASPDPSVSTAAGIARTALHALR